MSSDQFPTNSQTVEQTKQQIRSLVAEIAQLSKSDVGSEEYHAAFMQRVVSALAAVGGAVWMLGESQRPELAYQINLSETLLDPASDDTARHLRLLGQIVQAGQPQLVPPFSGAEGESSAANPTRYLLVLAPLIADGRVEGVIEVFQRPDSQPATQRGYLRFLVQMCELAAEWLKSRKLRHFSDRHSLWAQADQFARMVHENLDVQETSYMIVNEGRRLIGCDRVSVAIKRGRTCKVEAISGQDTIENRSNIVTALGHVATRVVATGESLWYEGSTEDLPPQVEEAVDRYVEESYAKSVVVLPLRKPGDDDEAGLSKHNAELVGELHVEREIIGALIVEQIETDLPREVLEPRIDLVFEHSTRALSNSLEYDSVFLMPVWKAIGKSTVLVKARNLPKTLSVAGGILAVILALFLIPTGFDLKADGTLQPVIRREVFFDTNGTIKNIWVHDGQLVKTGDKLITLDNPELAQEWAKLLGEISETSERMDSLRRASMQGKLSEAQAVQIAGERLQLNERAKSLKRQLELIKEKRARLTVASPINGQIMLPWDAEQSLLHRPVVTGQRVMTVADPDGPWQLELAMPERRMGHVTTARKDMKPDLSVSYILATDPRTSHDGTIENVYGVTQVKGQEGPTVKITVKIDKKELFEPRAGTSVTAKVNCGRCSLGYSWFHEAIEWVQKHLLF